MASRFIFPLQKVVDLKSSEKTQAEWILSQAYAQLKVEEKSLNDLAATEDLVLEEITKTTMQSADIHSLREMNTFVQHVQACKKQKQLDVLEARSHVNHSQTHLTDRMMDEKIWLNVKGRAYEAHHLKNQRAEQHELDEIASRRTSMR